MKKMTPITKEKIGLIAGYKPNIISLYIVLLECGRIDELREKLYKDMEPYREED